jgi:hypothetical protein
VNIPPEGRVCECGHHEDIHGTSHHRWCMCDGFVDDTQSRADRDRIKALLNAKHGDYRPNVPHLSEPDERGRIWADVIHPTQDAAEDWAAYVRYGGGEAEAVQLPDGRWANRQLCGPPRQQSHAMG